MSNQDPSDSEAASGEFEVGKFHDFHPIETEEPVGTARRIVIGIAASITLLVGALVVYNAFGTDESSTDASGTDESVDPTLTWTEYTPSWTVAYTPSGTATDQPYVYSVETVGDGRVLARAFTDTGTIIMISENGTDWTQAAVPHGISPDFIDVSGDRWLIAGHDATGFGPANRAFYSDSGGEDWTELTLDEIPGDQSSIILALASGQNMVIVFEISDDGQNPEEPPPDGQLMVYTSDGDTTTSIGQYLSSYTTGSSNAEGFHIVINTSEEEFLLTSADGFEWTETPTFDTVFPAPGSTGLRWLSRTGIWYIEAYSDVTLLKSLDQIGDPESTTATIRPVSHLFSLDVGPAGMVAIAVSNPSPRELLLGWSREGSNWEWWDPSVAFGVDGGPTGLGFAASEGRLRAPAVDFAVGTDFVLARVPEFATAVDTEHPQIRSIEWFKATVE